MIRLAQIFQDGMLVQREKPIRIWGETDRAQTMQAGIVSAGQWLCIVEEKVEAGMFSLCLPPMEAAEDLTLCVRGTAGDEITLKSVDIGEVWIAAGQSNMEFFLQYDTHGKETIAQADDDHIRYYNVAQYAFDGEERDGFKDESHWNQWFSYKPEHIGTFSAVGLYFANVIRQTYHIPVGIIGCNWGGTTASTWIDERILAEDEELKVYTDEYAKATAGLDEKTYCEQNRNVREGANNPFVTTISRYLMEGSHKVLLKLMNPIICSMPPAVAGPHNENRPGGLYHSMVSKIRGYTCRGVLWYQGESDDDHASVYAKLFSSLIGCWRRDWEDENLPFLFVQLAPFRKWLAVEAKHYPKLRRQQEIVAKTVPGAWMASIMDSGMEWDIHPKDKKTVGERLALLARGKVYGEAILCEAPELRRSHSTWEGNRIMLAMRHCGAGLALRGKEPSALRVFVDDREILDFQAEIKDDGICVCSAQFPAAENVRVAYAWEQFCQVNLYNSAGLSAKPFVWESARKEKGEKTV